MTYARTRLASRATEDFLLLGVKSPLYKYEVLIQ